MKAKTKIIIAFTLVGVIALGALVALIVVVASFNATGDAGFRVSYEALHVEAEVSMGYLVTSKDTNDPNSLTYTTATAGSDEKLTFSSSDQSKTVSKSFDMMDEIKLTKAEYLYLKYTFKHTGTATNSENYLNITLNNTFTELNNIKIDYFLYNPTLTTANWWMTGVNGLTVTRDGDNECVLFARIYVDNILQDALLDGAFVFSMTTSETEYYANMQSEAFKGDTKATIVNFALPTDETEIEGIEPVSLSADGSGPINKYQLSNGVIYIEYGGWDEIYATSCFGMFSGCSNLTKFNFIGNLNTKYVMNMRYVFKDCTNLTSIPLSYINTSSATNMDGFFSNCSKLDTIDSWNNFNTSNVTSMYSMFFNCSALTWIGTSVFDTAKVTNMDHMFYGCSGLSSIELGSFNTSNVTNMSYMFYGCMGLTSLNASYLETENVTGMNYMFYFCSGLASLNLKTWNTSKVRNMIEMFCNCQRLQTIYVGDGWSTIAVTESSGMFDACDALVGSNGTTYLTAGVDSATYARVDTAETPGYFTAG